MYSSCSCSKFRSLLPAPMDCMVGDDRPVRLYTSAEYGDRRPFYLGFTSVLHGRWSPFSSRFKFQHAETVGRYGCYLLFDCGMIAIYFAQVLVGGMIALYVTQVFVFITSIAVTVHVWWFDGFVDLSSEVLCVDRSLYVKCFFFCHFVSSWI